MEQVSALPDQAYELGIKYDLGTPKTVQKETVFDVLRVLLILWSITGGLALLAYEASQLFHFHSWADLLPFIIPLSFVIIIGMLIFLVAGIMAILATFVFIVIYPFTGFPTTYLFAEGLIHKNRRREKVMRFSEIVSLDKRPPVDETDPSRRKSRGFLNARFSDGKSFSISAKFAPMVIEKYLATALPDTIARYEAGEVLHFGKLSLDLSAFYYGQQIFLICELAQIGYEGETLSRKLAISKQGQSQTWASIPLRKLSNTVLLLQVLEYIRNKYVIRAQ